MFSLQSRSGSKKHSAQHYIVHVVFVWRSGTRSTTLIRARSPSTIMNGSETNLRTISSFRASLYGYRLCDCPSTSRILVGPSANWIRFLDCISSGDVHFVRTDRKRLLFLSDQQLRKFQHFCDLHDPQHVDWSRSLLWKAVLRSSIRLTKVSVNSQRRDNSEDLSEAEFIPSGPVQTSRKAIATRIVQAGWLSLVWRIPTCKRGYLQTILQLLYLLHTGDSLVLWWF